MKGNTPLEQESNFLCPTLKEQLDPRNAYYQLADQIDWNQLELDFSDLYSKTGRPSHSVRLMVSLTLIKYINNYSDEVIVSRWVENPYWQYLSGMQILQWKMPIAPSDMTHFRHRIGKEGAEKLLKMSIALFSPKILKEELVVDTTVQEKNISYPTDSKLAKRVIDTCVKVAKKEQLSLRQSYRRTAPQLNQAAARRKTAKQKKEAKRATRKLRTIGTRLVRELVRKMDEDQLKKHLGWLSDGWQILHQERTDKNKIYSLHEPHTQCIAKGKAHKTYEYGAKVSIARTINTKIILSALAFEENIYDGKTVPLVLENLKTSHWKNAFTYYC